MYVHTNGWNGFLFLFGFWVLCTAMKAIGHHLHSSSSFGIISSCYLDREVQKYLVWCFPVMFAVSVKTIFFLVKACVLTYETVRKSTIKIFCSNCGQFITNIWPDLDCRRNMYDVLVLVLNKRFVKFTYMLNCLPWNVCRLRFSVPSLSFMPDVSTASSSVPLYMQVFLWKNSGFAC